MKTKNADMSGGVKVLGGNYQCPMKCEENKMYDEPGNCPVCNMKLVPVDNKAHGHDHH
jgi:transcription initiation factor IIE alpha subunit